MIPVAGRCHVPGGDRTGDPAGPPAAACPPACSAGGRPAMGRPADHGPRLVTSPEGGSPGTTAATSPARPFCSCRWSSSSHRLTLSGYPPWAHAPPAWCPVRWPAGYNPRASPDGVRGAEGTFSACSSWYAEALARAGRLDEARLAFEKMLTYANHVGLYAEQISRAGQQQGNFPQALTHLALISAAFNLDRALGA